jgi:hypothetical protein
MVILLLAEIPENHLSIGCIELIGYPETYLFQEWGIIMKMG